MTFERDLTGFCDLAVGVSDHEGVVQAASARNAARLGLDVAAMLGRNWRDFTSAAEVDRLEPLGARALAGARVSTAFLAHRPDGSVALSRLTMMRFSGLQRAPRLLVVHQAIHVTAAAAAHGGRIDLSRCLADLGRDLVRTAEFHSLEGLSGLLAEVVEGIGGLPPMPRG